MDDEEILDLAWDAFWKVIAESYPQAKSGDLTPPTQFLTERVLKSAVREWKRLNIESEVTMETETKHFGPDQ